VLALAAVALGPTPAARAEEVAEPHQRLFLSGLTASWFRHSDADLIRQLEAVTRIAQEAGLPQSRVGISVEVAADSNAPVEERKRWRSLFSARRARVVFLLKEAQARAIPVQLHFFNSNAPGSDYRGSWDRRPRAQAGNLAFLVSQSDLLVNALKTLPSVAGIIVQPVNEDDPSMAPSVRKGLRAWWAAHWPSSQLLTPMRPNGKVPWALYVDLHPPRIGANIRRGIVFHHTSDNTPIVTALFGSIRGATVNVKNGIAYVRTSGRDQTSVSFYNVSPSTNQIDSQQSSWISIAKAFAEIVR